MAKKEQVKPLDAEMSISTLENQTRKKLSKEEKKELIKALIGSVPYVISVVAYIVTWNPTALMIGGVYLAGNIVVDIVADVIRNLGKEKQKAEIINFEEALNSSSEETVSKEITKEPLSIYQQRKKEEHKEEIKEVKLIDNYYGFTKEEAVTYLLDTINDYYKRYDIPAWTISPNDWDMFFDIMYSAYQTKDIKNVFFNDMFQLIKVFFANALVDGKGTLNINDLNNSLKYLIGSKFNEREILNLQKQVLTSLNENKIIRFDESYIRK